MQRALFLVEATGERLSALLNPERLEFSRRAGLRPLAHGGSVVTGAGLTDELVLATGGGATELVLDLLFDVDLDDTVRPPDASAGPSARPTTGPADVRELTRPFWNLAENAERQLRDGAPQRVRLIWGRSWNVLGVITAVAERFERFDEEGRPQRSFLRMKLRRAPEENAAAPPTSPDGVGRGSVTPFFELPAPSPGASEEGSVRVLLATDENGLPATRLDQLAARSYGDPGLWRLIAGFNGVVDPLHLAAGAVIAVPDRGSEATS